MMRFVLATAAMLGVTVFASTAQGQQVVLQSQIGDPGGLGEYLLAPVETPLVGLDGLPLTRPTVGGATAPTTNVGAVQGLAGGLPVGNNSLTASVGFTYLVPLWSFRGFELAAPVGFERFFPVFGTLGPVDSRFGYAPRINLDYYIRDLDLGVSASGTYINLSGRVDRQQTSSPGTSVSLNANSTVTLASANLIEFNRLFEFTDLFKRHEPKHENVADSIVDLRIGTRYVSLDQNYTGALTASGNPTNVTTRFSTQAFRGIGLTTAMRWTVPVGDNWASFLAIRESLIIGENRRNSVVTASVAGLPGFTASQFENRTQLVPVTELEFGTDFGWDLGNSLRNKTKQPRFTVRFAGVAQHWVGLGPFSAGTTQGFRSTDLFIVGGYVQAGFSY